MANIFDQFDATPATPAANLANPFDQFDAPPMRQNVGAEPRMRLERTNLMPSSDLPAVISYDKKGQRLFNGQPVMMAVPADKNREDIASQNLFTRAVGEVVGAAETVPAVLSSFPASVAYGYATTPEEQAKAQERAAAVQYTPRTPQGRRNLELVGEAAGSELLRPLQGALGLPLNMIPQGSVAPIASAVRQEASLLKQPLQNRQAANLAKKVEESYTRGPQIDAAKEANRLGILLDPAISNPTVGNKLREVALDPVEIQNSFSQQNKPKWANVAKREMGIPEKTPLTSSKAFDDARSLVSKPYEDIRKIPQLMPDAGLISSIDDLVDTSLIGGEATYNTLKSEIDSAKAIISSGASGDDALKNISNLRKKAQKTYKSNAAAPEAVDLADVRMGIANALEDLIESNVRDPKLLGEYRKARADMAKIYSYEAATDLATGFIDPTKLTRMLNKGIPLSGDAKSMAQIAGNYPEIASMTPIKREGLQRFSRAGALATMGAAIGSQIPVVGTIAGGAIGAGLGVAGSKVVPKRMSTPAYQAKRAVPEDYRPQVNMLNPAQINPNRNLPVPYVANELMPPEYVPNFVMPRNPNLQFGAEAVRTPTPLLPPPSGESTMAAVQSRRAYDYAAQKAAEERQSRSGAFGPEQPRKATSRGVELELDPVTGKLREASQGIKGATPETFQDFSRTLQTASDKMAQGKAFALDATEKIAWNKAKVDIAEIEPGFAKLSDKAVAERMMDRQWAASAVQKARDQAKAFEEIAARAKDAQARATAEANRQRMMDLADTLEESLRAGRPDTSRKTQGPKTREAIRNRLVEDVETKNKLAR